ncbi:MAG: amidohydrolase family protein, partial [Candidatus Binataceae bacterium]
MEYDLLIRNGTMVDGSGAARRRADVAVTDRRIAAIIEPTDSEQASVARVIDATGMIVAPGFIDLHSHSDWIVPLPEHGAILKPFLMQGVTTFVGGNCGFSVAPIRPGMTRMLDASGQMLSEHKFDWNWASVAEYGAHLERQGLALNVAHLAGHGSIRLSVMGASAADPSAEELRAMQA